MGNEINFESVTGMPYLTAVLNETLRYPFIFQKTIYIKTLFILRLLNITLILIKYSVLAPFAGRYSNEDEVLDGYAIPKGVCNLIIIVTIFNNMKTKKIIQFRHLWCRHLE